MDEYEDMLEDEDEGSEKQDNAAAAKARLDRQKAKLQKENEELRAKLAARERADREMVLKAEFEKRGIPYAAVQVYQGFLAAENPEEALPQLFSQYLPPQEETEEPAPPQAGFTPTVFEERTVPAAKKLTRAEFEDIMRVNPARGQALAEAGKVEWHNLPS